MSKKTIFTILASTIVALGVAQVHADTDAAVPARVRRAQAQRYVNPEGYDGQDAPIPSSPQGPAGLPYRGGPQLNPGYVVRGAYGVQNQAPIVNGTYLRPDGSPIPRGPATPVFGECQALPDGIYIVTSVSGAYPIRKYGSAREVAVFQTRDLETLIAAGNCSGNFDRR